MKENFMKKLRCILIAAIMAGIFLTACGSSGEEETEREITEEECDAYFFTREEDYIKLRGDFPADEIINELIEAEQQLSNDEGETESASLSAE